MPDFKVVEMVYLVFFFCPLIGLFGLCSNDILQQINQTLNDFIHEYHVYLKSPFRKRWTFLVLPKADCICAIVRGSQCTLYVKNRQIGSQKIKCLLQFPLICILKQYLNVIISFHFVSFVMWTKSIFVDIVISIVSLWMQILNAKDSNAAEYLCGLN